MSSVAKAVGSFFGFGGRSGGGGSPSGPSAEDAAAQARREAEAQAEKVRKEKPMLWPAGIYFTEKNIEQWINEHDKKND